jgi:hypothetical protein
VLLTVVWLLGAQAVGDRADRAVGDACRGGYLPSRQSEANSARDRFVVLGASVAHLSCSPLD